MDRSAIVSLMVALIILGGLPAVRSADNLTLGQQAEQAGNLRQALTHYVEALKTGENNRQLREKIIKLAQKIQPPPEVPEEARRHMVRGRAAVKAAKDKDGFSRAADEYKKALNIAPWLVDIYYDLGVLLDRSGQYKGAIDSLNIYLSSSPADAQAARDLIYEIEYRAEDSQHRSEQKKESGLEAIVGIWRGRGPYAKNSHLRADLVGNDLLWTSVIEIPISKHQRRGEYSRYRMRKNDDGFSCSPVNYDPALSTQEIGIEMSKDRKKIIFTEWHSEISPPDVSFTYYKTNE